MNPLSMARNLLDVGAVLLEALLVHLVAPCTEQTQ